ncbi:N-acetylmuramoyl-L-alanine amidase [Anianabacter salinae]|uniref:N-acetylmuramoyl-L-alanine amidase n=1 Tax=Anianabacter salinae TaxID=2851023 RepID=UPI00225E5FCB|nr:N-acetylmuramoyl-L-alanine amidase [Anianabacter salinae]MBV0913890.1 N-acetylmuramoyl-L-alanine amidase [Anianabacter salinae]
MTAPVAHPSPNCGPRRNGLRPSLIVLHYTAMSSASAALERLCDPAFEVSAHYLIGKDGMLWQLVDEADRAWHAGQGRWAGMDDINSRSIGIELDNSGAEPFSEPLMTRLEDLMAGIMTRWDIAPAGVIAHSDMAPTRKWDPGRRFDWRRLARQGSSVWPEPAAPGDFTRDAARFGYDVSCGEDAVLDAVRQRFRPWATGPLDDIDRALVAGLAARFGIDRDTP